VAETRSWVEKLSHLAPQAATKGIELAVLPTFPLLESTAATLRGTSIAWGAQNVAAQSDGAQTGEVSASVLADLGCRYVEVGHAERRRLFGETDDIAAAKVQQVVAHDMVPVLCVGERERATVSVATEVCKRELRAVLRRVAVPSIVVAYEPEWAIGASDPAPAEHVRALCTEIRSELANAHVPGRVLYGGSAGPGTYEQLAPAVEGLFLGRFAHNIDRLADIIGELSDAALGASTR
jgi:triosephosphate isomerase